MHSAGATGQVASTEFSSQTRIEYLVMTLESI